MFLIASAAYCSQELKSEFGRLPPSFLPLGNKRLYQHQIAIIPDDQKIYLSLPETFTIPEHDLHWLKQNNINILPLPETLTLGSSIVTALNLIGITPDTSLNLLFGDTLFEHFPNQKDIVSISPIQDCYEWAVVTEDQSNRLQESQNPSQLEQGKAVNGYFHFSSAQEFVRSVIRCKWDFIRGLNDYHQWHQLTIINVDDWLDFGHIHTYFRSKSKFTTQRAFNELIIQPHKVTKSSIKNIKIKAESLWFQKIPESLRIYLPQYLGSYTEDEKFSYNLEYLHHTALNELFVFGELPALVWRNIINSCLDFIDACRNYSNPNIESSSLHDLLNKKTTERLKEFGEKNNFNLDHNWTFNNKKTHSLNELLQFANKYSPAPDSQMNTVMHGDFCFSNILFDFRTSLIKTIDPRGITPCGKISIYGDTRYDLAKLGHSIIGLYDWIIAGYYQLEHQDYKLKFTLPAEKKTQEIQEVLLDSLSERYGLSERQLLAMQIHLFLSMLPLHADENKRQMALLANAFRLSDKLKDLIS